MYMVKCGPVLGAGCWKARLVQNADVCRGTREEAMGHPVGISGCYISIHNPWPAGPGCSASGQWPRLVSWAPSLQGLQAVAVLEFLVFENGNPSFYFALMLLIAGPCLGLFFLSTCIIWHLPALASSQEAT